MNIKASELSLGCCHNMWLKLEQLEYAYPSIEQVQSSSECAKICA
jgi:hypothetical protein